MIGGAGDGTYIVDTLGRYRIGPGGTLVLVPGDSVVETVGEGYDTVFSSVDYFLPTNVEKLVLIGTAGISGTGNGLDNAILGNTVANTLRGLDGNDVMDGGGGADTMIGGIGNDSYLVDNVGDIVTENAGEGIDTVKSSVGYTLSANVENLTLTGPGNIGATGNDLTNKLIGTNADNLLDGRGGADRACTASSATTPTWSTISPTMSWKG